MITDTGGMEGEGEGEGSGSAPTATLRAGGGQETGPAGRLCEGISRIVSAAPAVVTSSRSGDGRPSPGGARRAGAFVPAKRPCLSHSGPLMCAWGIPLPRRPRQRAIQNTKHPSIFGSDCKDNKITEGHQRARPAHTRP
ncbi:hypothetical protein AAFF_G00123410 [Aldrovandia affinis]|uniref:Uncharacterized protein n=1 Tax=Aldrovandia affinis TaxID=143900 RepID=A0AAD7RS18_9TELE|nr:hypothetical protein AAFF_G00123410 [Aldrovandia affinis]